MNSSAKRPSTNGSVAAADGLLSSTNFLCSLMGTFLDNIRRVESDPSNKLAEQTVLNFVSCIELKFKFIRHEKDLRMFVEKVTTSYAKLISEIKIRLKKFVDKRSTNYTKIYSCAKLILDSVEEQSDLFVYDTSLLQALSTFLDCLFSLGDVKIRQMVTKFWNKTFGTCHTLSYPEKLKSTLLNLKGREIISLPGLNLTRVNTKDDFQAYSRHSSDSPCFIEDVFPSVVPIRSTVKLPMSDVKLNFSAAHHSGAKSEKMGSNVPKTDPRPLVAATKIDSTKRITRLRKKLVLENSSNQDDFVRIEPQQAKKKLVLTDHQKETLLSKKEMPYLSRKENSRSNSKCNIPTIFETDSQLLEEQRTAKLDDNNHLEVIDEFSDKLESNADEDSDVVIVDDSLIVTAAPSSSKRPASPCRSLKKKLKVKGSLLAEAARTDSVELPVVLVEKLDSAAFLNNDEAKRAWGRSKSEADVERLKNNLDSHSDNGDVSDIVPSSQPTCTARPAKNQTARRGRRTSFTAVKKCNDPSIKSDDHYTTEDLTESDEIMIVADSFAQSTPNKENLDCNSKSVQQKNSQDEKRIETKNGELGMAVDISNTIECQDASENMDCSSSKQPENESSEWRFSADDVRNRSENDEPILAPSSAQLSTTRDDDASAASKSSPANETDRIANPDDPTSDEVVVTPDVSILLNQDNQESLSSPLKEQNCRNDFRTPERFVIKSSGANPALSAAAPSTKRSEIENGHQPAEVEPLLTVVRIFSPASTPSAAGILKRKKWSSDQSAEVVSSPGSKSALSFSTGKKVHFAPDLACLSDDEMQQVKSSPRKRLRLGSGSPKNRNVFKKIFNTPPPSTFAQRFSPRTLAMVSCVAKPQRISDYFSSAEATASATNDASIINLTRESLLTKSQPIYPPLVGNDTPIKEILQDLTNGPWRGGLLKYLDAKSFSTVGHLAQLTELNAHFLPIKQPKIKTLRDALEKFERTTHLAAPSNADENDSDLNISGITPMEDAVRASETLEISKEDEAEEVISIDVCQEVNNINEVVNVFPANAEHLPVCRENNPPIENVDDPEDNSYENQKSMPETVKEEREPTVDKMSVAVQVEESISNDQPAVDDKCSNTEATETTDTESQTDDDRLYGLETMQETTSSLMSKASSLDVGYLFKLYDCLNGCLNSVVSSIKTKTDRSSN